MNYENIIFERQESVAVIKFNRPEALNAITPDVLREVNTVLDDIEGDPSLRVLILTGEGEKSFVAGADIGYMSNLSPLEARRWARDGHELMFRFEKLPIPVIACVNGFALGGGTEIALACDFVYASENAKFGQPEINLGVIPGFGGTQRLARIVGKSMAKELCMTGVMISAKEAQSIGLVNKVFPPEKLWEETMKTANLIASKGKVSLRAVKECIDRGSDMDLHKGCFMEIDAFSLCMVSPDAKEGMRAFLEKRKPEFKGELI
ncbi:MAG: enoyl-CoA hydratase/isomerase family protein [Deltaproteobacteria bacterium]|mgnify:CR=1 FL=1|nr:enoyl-CoA hydratase/isomerase family protein [Deltaproteobacteria bacterium]MBW1919298.1 enoyl-CoA hydratase/isomerase family protein [Deltaproteobacteria bacterium]MBW1933956.1 enoyl-CoA hydratase/isomerase family protein [Deltaproteobacteria bacterium]MBW1976624.1 enoyl-CoA hydratase/isomerase family protein [Deltaproteobacteria bacterium]MBW2043297.1 enoyl-CoA hydratase/isomerase family protein [Deltaproteobacteria bacterium]